MGDPFANDLIKGLLADAASQGQEIEQIDQLIESDSTAVDVNKFAAQNLDMLEAAFGEDTALGQLFGGFSDGLRNQGQQRKGSRIALQP